MRQIENCYDAAIIDLPYNLCSVLGTDELLSMLRAARRWSHSAVIVSTKNRDEQLEAAGFMLKRQAVLRKGAFARLISVVE